MSHNLNNNRSQKQMPLISMEDVRDDMDVTINIDKQVNKERGRLFELQKQLINIKSNNQSNSPFAIENKQQYARL